MTRPRYFQIHSSMHKRRCALRFLGPGLGRLLLIIVVLTIPAPLYLTCIDAFSVSIIASFSSSKTFRRTSTSLDSVPTTTTTTSMANCGSTHAREKIRAAVYQPPITIPEPLTATEENPLAILTKIADVLRIASKCGVDIVQFPELFMNGGLFQNVISGRSAAPLDRESYALNIVGNLCAELNVACVMGYAERKYESECESSKPSGSKPSSTKNNKKKEAITDDVFDVCYSSLAVFHADGSRAGNCRCVHPFYQPIVNDTESSSDTTVPTKIAFEKGHPLVELISISVQLPVRPVVSSSLKR